ncbi:hypothetical protein LINPERHAP2_LOCUS6243 [Linum perenne]
MSATASLILGIFLVIWSKRCTFSAPRRPNTLMGYLLASSTDAPTTQLNWVLCRIFLKKRGSKNDDKIKLGTETTASTASKLKTWTRKPVFYEFMTKGRRDLNIVPCGSS